MLRRRTLWIALAALLGVTGVAGLLVGRAVTLDDARRWAAAAGAFAATQPVLVFLALAALHAALMALSLPLKALVTVVAGALLGAVAGAAATVIGVLAGTSLLFWAVRRGLRARFQQAMGERARRLEERLARRPIRAMAALRLVVTLPYGPITIAAALTRIRYRDFLLGSLVGDLPVIALYAVAGRELSRLRSLSDVLSPGTLVVLLAAAAVFLATVLFGRREPAAAAAAAAHPAQAPAAAPLAEAPVARTPAPTPPTEEP